MAILRATSHGGLAKYIPGILTAVGESMDRGTKLSFTTSGKTTMYAIKNTAENKKRLEIFIQKAASASTEADAKKLVFETASGHSVPIGNLEKKHVKDGVFNRGDVAEGILAAAIAARFINKNRKITRQDVTNILTKLTLKQGNKVDQVFIADNANPAIKDEVTLVITLAEINMKALLNPKNFIALEKLIDSSVRYANSTYITQWSKLMYENNVKNHIEVISDGLFDQSGTKVDLRVKIDGKRTNVNLSLKAGDVKQFGQLSGGTLKKMKLLFEPLGINIEQKQTDFNNYLNKRDQAGASLMIYKFVADSLNQIAQSNKKKFIQNLSKFIVYHATLNEENVTLVQLNRGEAMIYKFDNLQHVLQDVEPAVTLETGRSPTLGIQIPKIIIYDKSRTGKNEVLMIRMKLDSRPDGFYQRNYIEKGHLLGELMAEYA